VLVAVVTALRLAYVLWLCPYALIEDEAYYWLWSRHLDWSYATKGPGIALTIAGGLALLGDGEAGVRLAAPAWGAALALCVAGVAGELAPAETSGRARFWGAAIAVLAAPLQAMAVLMLIDGPVLACWAGAMWAAVRAMHRGGRVAWLGLGAAIGVGMLFKPVMLLLAVGLVVHAAASRRRLSLAPGWGWWLVGCVALGAMGAAPILVWNARHEWMTLTHLLGHVGGGSEAGAAPTPGIDRRLAWMGEYVGLQVVLGGVGLVMGVLGAKALLGRREDSASRGRVWLCVWSGVPVYTVYLAVSAFTRVEGNWALGGLIGWLALAGAWGASAGDRLSGPGRHLRRAAVLVGVVCGLGMLRLDLVARVPVVGRLIPVGRLMVGPSLADGVQRVLEDERVAGIGDAPALVLTDHYGSASQISFYLNSGAAPNRTPARVTCATGVMGRPPTQFDLWPDTRADDERLLGLPAVLIGSRAEVWATMFTSVHDAGPITGDHKGRRAFIGIGYRGGTQDTEAAGG